MNTVVVAPHGMEGAAFRDFVQQALRDGHIVFPVPPRMLEKQRQQVTYTLMNGPDAAGVAFMTTGTIGASKLIVRSAVNVASEAAGVAQSLGLHRKSKVLITTPITHSYGFGIFMACVEVGARTWVMDHENIFTRLIHIRELMRKHRFDVVTGVPFVFRSILRQVVDLKPPRLSLAGGETVPVELMERWEQGVDGPLRQEYGLSEVGVVTIARAEDPPRSIGRPVLGCSVGVSEDELVVFRKDNPTSYFSVESERTFTEAGGVRTGDLGFRDPQGLFYLKGRKDSLVIVGGMNVMPEEVESVLLNSPLIDECAVVGRPTYRGSPELVAHVAPALRAPQTLGAFYKHMKANLAPHKIPKIVSWSSLPRTASGKVDRSALLSIVPPRRRRK